MFNDEVIRHQNEPTFFLNLIDILFKEDMSPPHVFSVVYIDVLVHLCQNYLHSTEFFD